jgi:signal-transduction protein with cAMP-binding, CBS, and nucleotidyltransferase domain
MSDGASITELAACDLMTPGVVSIVEDAPLRRGLDAMAAHGVEAVLVVGKTTGAPLGWITATGVLPWLEVETNLITVRNAITQEPLSVTPGATARAVTIQLSQPGIDHVLVSAAAGSRPEGVITALDLVRWSSDGARHERPGGRS